MSSRERMILIVTVTLVVLALALTYLGDSLPSTESSSSPLAAERARFRQNIKMLEDGDQIMRDYKSIEVGLKDTSKGQRPETAFSNELFNLLTQRLGAKNPRIETAVFTEIPSVKDYCYVDIPLQIQGTYVEVMSLLREMEQIGLLIKSVKISQRTRNSNELVDLNLTVARLVKRDPRIDRILKYKSKRA